MCAVRYHEGAVSVLQHLQHQPRKTFNILNLKKSHDVLGHFLELERDVEGRMQ